MSNIEKYENEIKKAQEKLNRLKKAKEKEETRQLVKIGKLYVEMQRILEPDIDYENIEMNIQETVEQLKNKSSSEKMEENLVSDEVEEIEIQN